MHQYINMAWAGLAPTFNEAAGAYPADAPDGREAVIVPKGGLQ